MNTNDVESAPEEGDQKWGEIPEIQVQKRFRDRSTDVDLDCQTPLVAMVERVPISSSKENFVAVITTMLVIEYLLQQMKTTCTALNKVLM